MWQNSLRMHLSCRRLFLRPSCTGVGTIYESRLKMSPTIFPLIFLCVFRHRETAGNPKSVLQGAENQHRGTSVFARRLSAELRIRISFALSKASSKCLIFTFTLMGEPIPHITGRLLLRPSHVNNFNLAFGKWQFSMCLVQPCPRELRH